MTLPPVKSVSQFNQSPPIRCSCCFRPPIINSLDMNITSSCTKFPIFPPVGVQSEIIISVNTDICHFLSVCCKIMCQENCTNFHSLPHVSVTNWVFMAGRAESRFPCSRTGNAVCGVTHWHQLLGWFQRESSLLGWREPWAGFHVLCCHLLVMCPLESHFLI